MVGDGMRMVWKEGAADEGDDDDESDDRALRGRGGSRGESWKGRGGLGAI